jgi:hypothetical protein
MIEYMDANYFVCSSYLTTEQPPEEYDPQSAIKETTREAVNIQVSMEETATGTEEDTQEASQSEYMATMGADEEYTRLADLSMDDGSNAIHEGSHGSIIRVIFYVCIVLMIVIAVVFGFISIRERNRRKRRRRRINTDEWYK